MYDLIDGPLRRTGDGYEIPIRFDWYRSLPLSCVSVSVTFDGQPLPEEAIRFHINEHDYALDAMADLVDEFWFVLDAAKLRITTEEPVGDGTHDVEVEIALRIPYLFNEDTGNVLTVWSRPQATMVLT